MCKLTMHKECVIILDTIKENCPLGKGQFSKIIHTDKSDSIRLVLLF